MGELAGTRLSMLSQEEDNSQADFWVRGLGEGREGNADEEERSDHEIRAPGQ